MRFTVRLVAAVRSICSRCANALGSFRERFWCMGHATLRAVRPIGRDRTVAYGTNSEYVPMTGQRLTRLLCVLTIALAACSQAPKFPGVYAIIAFGKPGTHEPSSTVPRDVRGATLILREDGSATMQVPGERNVDLEYSVNAADHTATIEARGSEAFRARFVHDTLVTRVINGGPVFYWRRRTQ